MPDMVPILPPDLPVEPPPMDEYESLLQFLYSCPHGLAQFDRGGEITMVNPAFTGLALPLLPPGKDFGNLVDHLEPWLPELRNLLQDAPPRGMVCDGVRVHLGPASTPGQDPRVLALTVVRMDPDRHMAVLSDISQQAAQERRLRESEAWFAAVLQGVDDYAVLAVDEDGRVSDWNVSGERLFGRDGAEVLGQPACAVVSPGIADPAAFRHRLEEAKRDGWHLEEGWRQRADGTRFWGTCMVSPLNPAALAGSGQGTSAFAGPLAGRYMMVVRDISERRQNAAELRRALTSDHLTGVLNRRCFLERADQELRQQARRGAQSCIAMVDADRFKGINDTHGHAAGDLVLVAIAEVLRAETRDCDLVGRLGGEEFAVMMPGTTLEDAEQAAERLRAGVAALRLTHAGQPIAVTVSLGVSGDGEADLKRLLSDADKALYAAKSGGRNRVCRSALAPAVPVIVPVAAPALELAGQR